MLTLLALVSSAVWGTSDFLGGMLTRRLNPFAVVGLSQGAALALLSVVLLVARVDDPGPGWVWYAVAASIAGAGGLVAFYSALATGPMGVMAAIAALGGAVPVVLSVTAGESPSALTWAGMVCALSGAALAAGPEVHARLHVRPVLLACLAAVGFGLSLYFLSRGAKVSVVHTVWGMRLTTVAVFATVALALRRAPRAGVRDIPMLATVGICDVTANGLFAVATTRGLVSVASVLGSLYPLATIALARIVLHERLRVVQNVGVALTVLGVAAMAAG